MSIHLLGCKLCLHLKRIWDGKNYRLTFAIRTPNQDVRIRLLPPGVRITRLS